VETMWSAHGGIGEKMSYCAPDTGRCAPQRGVGSFLQGNSILFGQPNRRGLRECDYLLGDEADSALG